MIMLFDTTDIQQLSQDILIFLLGIYALNKTKYITKRHVLWHLIVSDPWKVGQRALFYQITHI